MKAIINWIILIPVLLLSVGVELFSALNPTGAESFFGMDANGISEIILIAVVALFVLFFLMSLLDRKTSPVHVLRRNYVAGVCGIVAAFALAGDTAASVSDAIKGGNLAAIDVVLVIVSALAAVSLLLVGINHCTGTNTKTNTAIFYLSLPLWCAVHLLSRFMAHTAKPVAMADTLDLVMYVFLAIFFMYAMMVVSLINGKNPVKATIYWGAPAAVSALVYAVSLLGNVMNTEGSNVFDYLNVAVCGFIGLYVISFMAELSFMSKSKEEQTVLEAVADDTDDSDAYVNEADEQDSIYTKPEAIVLDSAVEDEISESMKKFYTDISSVESEVCNDDDTVVVVDDTDFIPVTDTAHDYGSYFDSEEPEDMHIQNENLTVDTSKKHYVDKSAYPADGKTIHEPAIRDESYIVGLDQLGEAPDKAAANSSAGAEIKADAEEKVSTDINENYEARLDEIDRLIISIQGGEQDK